MLHHYCLLIGYQGLKYSSLLWLWVFLFFSSNELVFGLGYDNMTVTGKSAVVVLVNNIDMFRNSLPYGDMWESGPQLIGASSNTTVSSTVFNLVLQQIAFKNLVQRNRQTEQQANRPPPPNSIIHLPFIIVNTSKKTVIDCSISNDKYVIVLVFIFSIYV